MLHKNKCCFDDDCFDRSEKMMHDKMEDWSCRKPYKHEPCHTHPEDECDMKLAMTYVKHQKFNPKTLKDCDDALKSGPLFDELDLPFTGGNYCD